MKMYCLQLQVRATSTATSTRASGRPPPVQPLLLLAHRRARPPAHRPQLPGSVTCAPSATIPSQTSARSAKCPGYQQVRLPLAQTPGSARCGYGTCRRHLPTSGMSSSSAVRLHECVVLCGLKLLKAIRACVLTLLFTNSFYIFEDCNKFNSCAAEPSQLLLGFTRWQLYSTMLYC